MSDLRKRLLEAFKTECPEHLEGIRKAMEGLPQGLSEEEFYSVMRHAHTLKGAARAAALPVVERAAHQLETVFTSVREGERSCDETLTEKIHQLLDAIEGGVAGDQAHKIEIPDFSTLVGKASGGPEPRPAPAVQPEPEKATPATASSEGAVRLNEGILDTILQGSGEILSHETLRQHEGRRLGELQQQVKALHRYLNGTLHDKRVALTRVEELARLCSELVQEHRVRSAHFKRTARQLFGAVSDARLVSADGVLVGLGRMVRELARSQNKNVRYLTKGLETRVDREVLQRLKEPILHTLRNAVHHGVEPPEQRLAAGKPSTATIELELKVEQNNLFVIIRDDGGGLREEEILEKASQQGLTGTLEEILAAPELTTASVVSDIAGRGLGLTITREVIDALQGTLKVESRPGEGASFEYRVPVSLFSQLLVFVSSLGQLFALQSRAVEAMIRVPHDDLENVEGQPMLPYRDELLPIGDLSNLISQGYPMTRFGDLLSVLVVKHNDRRGAIVVDGFDSCQRMMVRPSVVPGMPKERFVGTVLREDGTVCLVLNIRPLLAQLNAGTATVFSRVDVAREEPISGDWPASILVVDDSITTRTLEKSILETHGYHVLLAVDGFEALRILEHNQVDLVISDVEMPNLDGFGLLERMKDSDSLIGIPVILLTSRKDLEDQKRGLELGAEAYLVKQDFDQLSLLEAVRQII